MCDENVNDNWDEISDSEVRGASATDKSDKKSNKKNCKSKNPKISLNRVQN